MEQAEGGSMHSIAFITGNQHKLSEIQAIIPHITGIDIDLPEIQELDAHAIIAAKLAEAQKHHLGPCIVEDTSLYIDALNGLPGPLAKWFVQAIGVEGIYTMTTAFGNARARAQTLIGYADEDATIHFFSGNVSGTIVSPRGLNGFGWDSLFCPDGSTQTFAQMNSAEKNRFSMRRIAAEHVRTYLESAQTSR
jgi:non-canonical purine NTP pyrophosphatase (RdgB/HAM1 family)